MDIDTFRVQLENELSWRFEEIRFFQNQCALLESEPAQKRFRRALILLLYSHFEGFCKFSLSLYVAAINEERILCKDATPAIAAAALADVLQFFRDGTGKAQMLRDEPLPADKELHRFARDKLLVEKSAHIFAEVVVIPDRVIDTESNLKPAVLKKMLFRLGLPHDQFNEIESEIQSLLRFRNQIAHGESKEGLDGRVYEKIQRSAFHIMNSVVRFITDAFDRKLFLAS